MSEKNTTPQNPESGEPTTLRDAFLDFTNISLGSDEVTIAEGERKKKVDEMLAVNTANAAREEWLRLMETRRAGEDIDPDVMQAARDHHLDAQNNLRELTQPQVPEEPPTTG